MTLASLMLAEGPFEYHSDTPLAVITGTGADPRPRMRVDVGSTAFWEGRLFRSFYDATLPVGQTAVLKFVAPSDFLIAEQTFQIAVGYCKFTAELGGTEGGTFTQLAQIGVNRMSNRPLPLYEPQCVLSAGGTHTGGTVVEVAYLKSAGNTQQSSTVGGTLGSARGLPAGTYYLKFQNLGNEEARGVYSLVWEEWQPRSPQIK